MRAVIEAQAKRRYNYERARAFASPVLHSLHPDALLVGYSVLGEDNASFGNRDRMVEANHVSLSSLDSSTPIAFTCRTWKFGSNLEVDFYLHAIDHLRVSNSFTTAKSSSKQDHNNLLRSLASAEQRDTEIEIDGEIWRGKAIHFHNSDFVQILKSNLAAMITIAAPSEFITAEFSSRIPD